MGDRARVGKRAPGPTDALLNMEAVRPLVGGLSAVTIRRWVAKGRFPAPIVLSLRDNGTPSRVAWSERAVQTWIRQTIRDRSVRQ